VIGDDLAVGDWVRQRYGDANQRGRTGVVVKCSEKYGTRYVAVDWNEGRRYRYGWNMAYKMEKLKEPR